MSNVRKIQRYGWIPDHPDSRDLKFNHLKLMIPVGLPPSVDLRSGFSPCYDQGDLGSCTANAAAGAVEFLQIKEKTKTFTPSRLFIYYYERVIEGTVSSDSGATIRDSMKVIASMGAPPESMWPYNTGNFAVTPPDSSIIAAKRDLITQYLSVLQAGDALKTCLVQGYPVNIGFTVYDSFESNQVATTGLVPMPGAAENVLGGHAVVVVGYDDNMTQADGSTKGCYIMRNSWGISWGDKGYFYMPFQYLEDPNLADDFWTVRNLSDTL